LKQDIRKEAEVQLRKELELQVANAFFEKQRLDLAQHLAAQQAVPGGTDLSYDHTA